MCTTNSVNKFSLSELIEISSTSAECYHVVRSVLKQRYDLTVFAIRGPFLDDGIGIDEESTTLIHLHNYKTINIILKRFGDLIRKMWLSFEQIEMPKAKQIVGALNKDGPNTLDELNLEGCSTKILALLTNTFSNVHTLAFSSSLRADITNKIDDFTLKSIFPNLYALRLGYISETDWVIFDIHAYVYRF